MIDLLHTIIDVLLGCHGGISHGDHNAPGCGADS
jgi:hypothetical protein